MTLFFLVRLSHLLCVIVWLGGGLSVPVTLDVRRTFAAGGGHAAGLVARLKTTSAIVIPAGLLTFVTGLGLIELRGGFGAAPIRMRVAMALTLSIYGIGGMLGRPALLALEEAVKQGDLGRAEAAGKRFSFWVRCEDVVRLSVLVLMVVPI